MRQTMMIPWAGPLLVQQVDCAVRVLMVACLAGLALALLRPKAASWKLLAWTAVLYAGLLMPLLIRIFPAVPISMPGALSRQAVFLRAVAEEGPAPARKAFPEGHPQPALLSSPPVDDAAANAVRSTPAESAPLPEATANRFSTRWAIPAGALYGIVALALLTRLVSGSVLSRRLVCRARSIGVPATVRTAARPRRIFRGARIAESDLIEVPLTVGVFRATVLLPLEWRGWSQSKLDAVIAHELSHAERGDGFTQVLSLLHRAIFWFSPFAWWLDRQLQSLAEQASDEAALTSGADRNEYARTLLGFLELLRVTPQRVWWQGVSMARAGQMEQRLEKILGWKGSVAMRVKKSVVVAIVAFAIPVVYLAAAARPASPVVDPAESAQQPAAPRAPLDSPPARSTVAPMPAAPADGVSNEPPPAAPVEAPAGIAPETPQPAQEPETAGGPGMSFGYGYENDDSERFVIVSGSTEGFTMSGSVEDALHVQALKRKIPGGFIWFQRDEKSYVIRDQATVDRARKLWAPQEELGKQQAELGRQQEELGKQQEELGEKMQQVRVKVPDLTAQLDQLKAEIQQLGAGATMEEIGDLQSEIGELQSRLGAVQGEAGDRQGKLGALQGELGEKQGRLGARQGELGRRQAELAKRANIQMKSLLDEALKEGKAQPEVEQEGGASL